MYDAVGYVVAACLVQSPQLSVVPLAAEHRKHIPREKPARMVVHASNNHVFVPGNEGYVTRSASPQLHPLTRPPISVAASWK